MITAINSGQRAEAVKRCRAMGCSQTIPPEHFMCRRHRFMLPAELRRDVYMALQSTRNRDQEGQVKYGHALVRAISYIDATERTTK